MLVELANGCAVRALHVVGIDFQLGLGVGGRRAVEQHRLHRLRGIGLLRIARDQNLAQIAARRAVREDGAHRLVARRPRLGMAQSGHDLERLGFTADDRAAHLEMRALGQRDVERDPPELAAGVEDVEFGARVAAQRDGVILHRHRICVAHILHDDARDAFTRRDVDRLALARHIGPDARQRLEVAIAPRLVLARGQGKRARHATTCA